MKNIAVLVPESAVMEAVSNPRYIFTAVNQFLENAGGTALFNVQLVGKSKEVKLQGGAFSVHVDLLLEEAGEPDLIIVPALFGNLNTAVNMNMELIPWIIKKHQAGSEVASLCLGAFLLAATGLLDGKQCSTHWAFSQQFKSMYPQIELVDGGIISESKGIYTSGGANSYWNLLLYLVEKYTDRAMAIQAAKYFAIDIDRNSQSPFTIFKGQKDHLDKEIKQAQEYIELNYQKRIGVDELADKFAISRRSFERRFKKATNNTVMEYIQRTKIESAKRSFELKRQNINEVMYDVGYTDNKAFRMAFKKITGLTPIAYRNKYNKDVL